MHKELPEHLPITETAAATDNNMVFLNDQHLKAYMKATEQKTETLEERLDALIATTDAISEKLEEIIAFLETK